MFDRILLALDDSPAGEVATVFSAALARRTGATVHVLHVNERLVGGNGLTLRSRHDAAELVTNAVQQLADAGVRAAGSVRVAAYRGIPMRIVEAAHDRKADAIVLGSNRGRHLARLFSAQVRERTTRLTALPVLTAPSPLKVSTLGGASAWQDGLGQTLDSLLN